MGSWPDEYHEIRSDSRSHWLPTNCHRGSEAAVLLSLELVQPVRSRQGYHSLWSLRVGKGSLLTLSGVVLDNAAGKDKGQSRKTMRTQVLETENHRSHDAKRTEGYCSVHFVGMDFQIHRRKHPPQPSLPCLLSYQDKAWGNEKESYRCQS